MAPVIALIIGKEGLLDEIGTGKIHNWGKGKTEATIYCTSTDPALLGLFGPASNSPSCSLHLHRYVSMLYLSKFLQH